MTVFCEAGIQEQTARSQHFLVRGKCDVDITVLLYESVRNAVFTNKPKMCLWLQRISTGHGHCNFNLNSINNYYVQQNLIVYWTKFFQLLEFLIIIINVCDDDEYLYR